MGHNQALFQGITKKFGVEKALAAASLCDFGQGQISSLQLQQGQCCTLAKKRRGRPKGSKNKLKQVPAAAA
ncbi:hypothetical protein MKX01_004296 [Papaver californicum]|nr:hypothetical protein MKX01_004296 [Papaver californicum]